ncbi:MAG: chemotaxis protein CheW [Candidatus Vecturithrix sp.]|jgi:purine-binding chemotaxis protein CheW|nr:chemotaxis protein CheW [Candidatus Vecturithrix sp.]
MTEQGQMNEQFSDILEAIKQKSQQGRMIEIEEKFAQLVIFLLAERYYAFYGWAIKEIVTVREIAYIPGMPEYILGVIHVRGDIESVLDLRRVMKLPQNVLTKRSRILLGETPQLRSGLLVDSVEDVLEIPETHISEPRSILEHECMEYIRGESVYKGRELLILDIEKIFGSLLKQ